MNIWLQGWQVGLIGLLLVLAGFVLLVGLRNRLKNISTNKLRSGHAEEPLITLELPVPVAQSDLRQEADDQAIIAAITAALQYMLSAETDAPRGFIVRRIRRTA